jgi:fatty acid desaturase
MPILAEDDDTDFLRRQVLTSRNVRGGWLVDFLLGGLNYQIEHHLFPSMPRASLRRAQPIVRAHCRRHGLPYVETSLFDSYRQALHHLHTAPRGGQPVREFEPAAVLDADPVAADRRRQVFFQRKR